MILHPCSKIRTNISRTKSGLSTLSQGLRSKLCQHNPWSPKICFPLKRPKNKIVLRNKWPTKSSRKLEKILCLKPTWSKVKSTRRCNSTILTDRKFVTSSLGISMTLSWKIEMSILSYLIYNQFHHKKFKMPMSTMLRSILNANWKKHSRKK